MNETQIKNIAKMAGVVTVSTGLAAGTAYAVARLMMKTALDREPPEIALKAGSKISGITVDDDIMRQRSEAAASLEARGLETLEITSHDGIRLVGHWYPCDHPSRVILAMHGWRSSWSGDFGMIAGFFHENHCSVLYVEQRGQGDSDGEYMGFGVMERFDCLTWTRWLAENRAGKLPVYLCGVSMGATTVLMATGLGLPRKVHGIIADCGFTSPDEIWDHVATENLHLAYPLHRPIIAEMYGETNPAGGMTCSTVDALEKNTIPVLFIHGTADHFVPVEMTYQNFIACSAPKRLLIVPGADHGMSYLVDRERYEAGVRLFWKDFDPDASSACR